ncbi:MAG TPA: S-layer homology domain-containing protein [Thermoanaerobaculia bacterium]|nr:S-layer homology domain-containing protein [Thermoanaerobaculia bacterium]
MTISRSRGVLAVCLAAALTAGAGGALLGLCGPFTDVAADVFCPFVLEIFYLGITTGTTATTYDPASNVTRLQMAAFLSRTVDRTLQRGSRRAALNQFWTTQDTSAIALTTVGTMPHLVACDGADVWVPSNTDGNVTRVRASDEKVLETWTGLDAAYGVISAMGKILVSGATSPGILYMIDPSQPPGSVTTVASNLGSASAGITFDGARVWTGNGATVSIITPGASIPWTVTTFGGFAEPNYLTFDGSNIWVADRGQGKLFKLDSTGAVLQTVTVGSTPQSPAFDGSNIWSPNGDGTVSVIRPSTGVVLATLTGNGLLVPAGVAFDGQRAMVTDLIGRLSLWKAADLSPLGFVATGLTGPWGVCSDGVNFWIVMNTTSQLARF